MTHDDKIFFRITCNQENDAIWVQWDKPDFKFNKNVKFINEISALLKKFKNFDTYRMVFPTEKSSLGSNPFSKIAKHFFDTTCAIKDEEILCWRELMLSLKKQ